MKPSVKCKSSGLKRGLTELSEETGESMQTLNHWHKNKPRLFELVLKGVVAERFVSRIKQTGEKNEKVL